MLNTLPCSLLVTSQLLLCYCQHFYDLVYSGIIVMHTVMIARMKCLSVD